MVLLVGRHVTGARNRRSRRPESRVIPARHHRFSLILDGVKR